MAGLQTVHLRYTPCVQGRDLWERPLPAPVPPTEAEITHNPRAASAQLWWSIRAVDAHAAADERV
jgi:16S rRNA C1402 N4-methylase RsmH